MPENTEWEVLDACPVCRCNKLTKLAALNNSLETAECDTCGHSFHNRRPSLEWCGKWYSGDWDGGRDHQETESGLRDTWRSVRTAQWRVAERLRYRFSKAALSDACYLGAVPALQEGNIESVISIGCGNGSELVNFKFAGCEVNGIEASEHRVNQANRLVGGGIKSSMVEGLNEDTFGRCFDLVISNHVVEHCLDLHEVMAAVMRVIKPGGWLQFSVPNRYRMPVFFDLFYALHPQRFCRNSLIHLMRQYGFEPNTVHENIELRVLAQLKGEPKELDHHGTPGEAGTIRPEEQLQNQLESRLQNGENELFAEVTGRAPVILSSEVPSYLNSGVLKLHEVSSGNSILHFTEVGREDPSRFWVK